MVFHILTPMTLSYDALITPTPTIMEWKLTPVPSALPSDSSAHGLETADTRRHRSESFGGTVDHKIISVTVT
jgi:hypothetical protein